MAALSKFLARVAACLSVRLGRVSRLCRSGRINWDTRARLRRVIARFLHHPKLLIKKTGPR